MNNKLQAVAEDKLSHKQFAVKKNKREESYRASFTAQSPHTNRCKRNNLQLSPEPQKGKSDQNI